MLFADNLLRLYQVALLTMHIYRGIIKIREGLIFKHFFIGNFYPQINVKNYETVSKMYEEILTNFDVCQHSLKAFTENLKVHPDFLCLGGLLINDMLLLGFWLLYPLLSLQGDSLGVSGWGRGKSSCIRGGWCRSSSRG